MSVIGLDERPLAAALLRRGEDRPRTLRVSVREAPEQAHGIRAPRLVKPVRPEPNAPLLMRVVRTPYALVPVPFIRIEVVPPVADPMVRVSLERPGRPFRALLVEIRGGGGAARRGDPRPRPGFVPRPFPRRSEP